MTDQLDLVAPQSWETRHQREIDACARRMEESPYELAHAMKNRAYVETIEAFVTRLLDADSNDAVRLALSIFTRDVARLEH